MSATAIDVTADQAGREDTGLQYLTFRLAEESYGVDILRVQEIKGWVPVTTIPNTPEYLRGVLNLRGTIVPIVDMRMRFNLDKADYTATTVIIVLSVESDAGRRVIGVVVDAVSDVLNFNAEDVKPTPDFGTSVNTEYLSGLATVNDQMVMLLDVDKLMNSDELAELEGVAE